MTFHSDGHSRFQKHEKWRNDDFWRVAQSMDPKSIIGLSQYLDVDLRFFLPLKKFPDGDRKVDVYENLYALLAQLPLEDTDAATKYFTEQALKSWRKKVEKSDGEENDTCYDAGKIFLSYPGSVKYGLKRVTRPTGQ